jgi:hypothetical protein
MKTLLEEAGHNVSLGVSSVLWDGTQADLNDFDVVILQNSFNWDSGSMPVSGQNALITFVNNGGGLVTGEWLIWNIYSGGRNTGLAQLVPATLSGSRTIGSATYTQANPDSIINNGLPASFDFPLNSFGGSESHLVPKQGATAFYTSDSTYSGLVGWDYCGGRVISFSNLLTNTELSDSDLARLFVNAVQWSGVSVGPMRVVFSSPANGAQAISIHSAVEILFNRPVDPTTMTSETFKVTSGGIPIPGTYLLATCDRKVIWVPDAGFSFGATFNIAISEGITDMAGNPGLPFTS